MMSRATDCDRRLKDENARLQREADALRYEQERLREEQQREHEQSRRDRQEEYRQRMRQADDWPEAFDKAISLFQREADEEAADNRKIAAHVAQHPEDASDSCWQPMTYFAPWPDKIRRMKAIYTEVFADAEREIAAIRGKALNAVAERVAAETDEKDMAEAIAANDFDPFLNW